VSYLQTLKNRLSKNKNFLLPTVLDENFLNYTEVCEIKEKVLNLKQMWEYHDPVNGLSYSIPVRFLSQGMYSCTTERYLENVNYIKPIMAKHFLSLYTKIKLKLQEYFNVPTVFSDITHYPGFHIFALNDNFLYGNYEWYNFHVDGFELENIGINKGRIYSFVIPIDLPKSNSSLLYTEQSFQSESNYNQFTYKLGMLGMWGGDISHSIEPFHLDLGEYRITLQFHVNLTDNQALIFW
jgi:hypothetical protein